MRSSSSGPTTPTTPCWPAWSPPSLVRGNRATTITGLAERTPTRTDRTVTHKQVWWRAPPAAVPEAEVPPVRQAGGRRFKGKSPAMTAKAHTGSLSGHVVLLGDSIFDNKAYVSGGPDVVSQLRGELTPGWQATLLALDGDAISGVLRQIRALPDDATHLVISAGGNDALGFAHLLDMPAGSVAEALDLLATAQERFAADYESMTEAVSSTALPSAVCTIYDTPSSGPGYRTIRTALTVFNDCITRAAFARGISLIDLRLICHQDSDYANPIEPSVQGGAKISRAIAALIDPGQRVRRSAVIGKS
jgi:hypothetical protein